MRGPIISPRQCSDPDTVQFLVLHTEYGMSENVRLK
jgi:hypothetical protein